MSFWHRHYVVKLCVHFVSMCHVSRSQKWTQTDTKVTFHPPPPPTMKLFLVSNERYGQKNTFLLRYYGTNFASIKRYDQFCLFTVVYKEAQIHPLLTLFILFSCYSFCSHCLPSSPSLCLLYLLSLSLPSLSFLLLLSLYTLSPILNSLSFLCPLFLCFYTL